MAVGVDSGVSFGVAEAGGVVAVAVAIGCSDDPHAASRSAASGSARRITRAAGGAPEA